MIGSMLWKYVLGSPVMRVILLPVLLTLMIAAYGETSMCRILMRVQEDTSDIESANRSVQRYLIVGIASYTVGLVSLYAVSSYIENICREYILDLYREHINIALLDFKRIGVGNMISFINRKATSFYTVLETTTKSFIMFLCCTFMAIFEVYTKLGPAYAGVAMTVILVYGATAFAINYYRNLLRLKLNREVDLYRRRVYNNILNHDIIKSYNNEEEEADGLHRSMAFQTSYAKMYWSWFAVSNFIGENAFMIAMFFVILYYSDYTATPRTSSAKYGLFIFLFNSMRMSCVDVSNGFALISFNITNISQTRNEPVRLDADSAGQYKDDFCSEIVVRDLQVSAEDKVLISGVNARLRRGEKIMITGPNGSGKSSFVKALLGFLDYEGSILLDNVELRDLNKAGLRKMISYSPQESHLFNESVASNIRNGNLEITSQEILEQCKKFQMHETFCNLNDGYETSVGERGKRLSGGQKQKVSFMRAVVKNASIFIFDQITSNLDKESETHIVDMICEHLRDATVIMIAQNIDLFSRFDKVYFFEEGAIAGEGTADELLRTNNAFRMYVQGSS